MMIMMCIFLTLQALKGIQSPLVGPPPRALRMPQGLQDFKFFIEWIEERKFKVWHSIKMITFNLNNFQLDLILNYWQFDAHSTTGIGSISIRYSKANFDGCW